MRNKKLCSFIVVIFLALTGCSTSPERALLAHEILGTGLSKVIVLHDWLGDRGNYDPVLPYLNKERYTYALLDVRGYGGSINIKGQFTSQEISDDVLFLADTLGWSKFHIIGHSMTGMAVQRVAVNAPGRVLSMLATTPVSAGGLQTDSDTRAFLEGAATKPEITSSAVLALTGKRLSSDWVAFKTDRAFTTSTKEARLKYLDMFDRENFSDAVKGQELPVTVILGEHDLPFFQPDYIATTFGKSFPNLTVESISDAGHYPMQEVPAYYATLLTKHLDNAVEDLK